MGILCKCLGDKVAGSAVTNTQSNFVNLRKDAQSGWRRNLLQADWLGKVCYLLGKQLQGIWSSKLTQPHAGDHSLLSKPEAEFQLPLLPAWLGALEKDTICSNLWGGLEAQEGNKNNHTSSTNRYHQSNLW